MRLRRIKIPFLFMVILVELLVVGACLRMMTYTFEASRKFVTPLGESDVVWTMINVNDEPYQGDAHLILSKSGISVLIDGGDYVKGRERMLPYLRNLGLKRIDFVIISHPHNDHYGGVMALLESEIHVGKIFWSEPSKEICESEPWGCAMAEIEKLKTLARERYVPLVPMQGFQRIRLGEHADLQKIFHVEKDKCPVPCTMNDMSVLVRLTVSGTRALFTGDLDKNVGDWLAKEHPDVLKATILKVPHHGATSHPGEDFFKAVSSSVALVPSFCSLWLSERCEQSRFIIEKLGNQVYSNAMNGHVSVHFLNNKRYWIEGSEAPVKPIVCNRKKRSIWERVALFK
jgi:competence protein ComEC